jgi:hypothetical protein
VFVDDRKPIELDSLNESEKKLLDDSIENAEEEKVNKIKNIRNMMKLNFQNRLKEMASSKSSSFMEEPQDGLGEVRELNLTGES